jgi:hypothetical protein
MCTPEEIHKYLLTMTTTIDILSRRAKKCLRLPLDDARTVVEDGLLRFLFREAKRGNDPIVLLGRIKANTLTKYEKASLFGKFRDVRAERTRKEIRQTRWKDDRMRVAVGELQGIDSQNDEVALCVWLTIEQIPGDWKAILLHLMYPEQTDLAFRLRQGWSRRMWEFQRHEAYRLFMTRWRDVTRERLLDIDFDNEG